MTPKRNDKPKTRRGVATTKRGALTLTFDMPSDFTKQIVSDVLLERLGGAYGGLSNFKIRRGSIDFD